MAPFDALKLMAGQSDHFAKGNRLSIGVGMPVASAKGEMALNLAEEDRQMDHGATRQTALSNGLRRELKLIHSDNFANRAGMAETAGSLTYAFRF